MTNFSNTPSFGSFDNKNQYTNRPKKDIENKETQQVSSDSDLKPTTPAGNTSQASSIPEEKNAARNDALFENLDQLAYIATNSLNSPLAARITQSVLHGFPSPEDFNKLYDTVVHSLHQEFNFPPGSEKSQALAEMVISNLLIGEPSVKTA
jgi:hypothetical protein